MTAHLEPGGTAGEFDEPWWEQRYRSHPAVWSGRPNPQLEAETADLTPGAALEVGAGEGADAVWLAARGWQVTAVDFSTTALQRGAANADALGADLAGRIHWLHADLLTWVPPESTFDLVSAQFMHLPAGELQALFARLSAAVAPGGTLLIVGHHPRDLETSTHGTALHRAAMADRYFTAETVADSLDPERWDVQVADTRSRAVADPDGRQTTIHDAVLRSRRRR